MQFKLFSEKLANLEKTDSRLEMMYQLADLYTQIDVSEIKAASYLMQGSLVPAYLSLEFQLSIKTVLKALATIHSEFSESFGEGLGLFGDTDISSSLETVTKKYKSSGDIGEVAFEIVQDFHESLIQSESSMQSEKNDENEFSILVVYEKLVEIAKESGTGSQERKLQKLVSLLKFVAPISAKFITRIIVGKLRLGFSAMTILDAFSWAVTHSKEHRKLLEDAYQKRADVGELGQAYLELAQQQDNWPKEKDSISEKSHKLSIETQKIIAEKLTEKYQVQVGVPVIPALCQRLNTAKEIIEKMGTVIAEPKYDGLRVQIHYSKKGFEDGTHVRAFTRNLEEVTHMFPELLDIGTVLKTDACILDSEAIGYDSQSGELLPFQSTITRKRKHDVAEASQKVPIRFYVFDVLFSGNASFINKNLHRRKDLLKGLFEENRILIFADYIVTSNDLELHQFHEKKLHEGLEGAVIKQVDSDYQSGRKGWSWVKIKETEGTYGKLKDTLDLIVMGYYFGRGKRSQFGVGAFLVGVLNDKQEIKTIAKIGTGLSDEQFKELKIRGDELATQAKPAEYDVEKSLIPDVWMKPELVVEIAADEITKSPTHSAGVALRFPRLIDFRDDKNWTDATTIVELENF